MSDAYQDTLREAWFATAVVAGIWFACHVYEIGFLARFGVPPLLANVGFPLPLAAALIAVPAGAAVAGLLLWPVRRLGVVRGAAGFDYPPLWGLATLGVGLSGLATADTSPLLLGDFDIDINPFALILIVSLAAAAALLFERLYEAARSGDLSVVVQSALIVLALTVLPFGLGWIGAGHKMQNKRSFFHLVEQPDYVLVRLYDDNAVFVRYDAASGRFSSDYLIQKGDDPYNVRVARRPRNR